MSIILVSDDAALADRITATLPACRRFIHLDTHASLRAALHAHHSSLLIVDASRTTIDVADLCREVRRYSRVPIIALIDVKNTERRVETFDAGADDCISPSADGREIAARINVILRKSDDVAGHRQDMLMFDQWCLDPNTRQLWDPAHSPIRLTGVEFDLLEAFCRHSGMTLSRRQLMEFTHAGISQSVERSIDVHISRLRHKIQDRGASPRLILTIRSGGYRFTPLVVGVPPTDSQC
ncbi:winged helix-turn-helix domain-containing protein [Rhizobium halophytocola]|uniref:DNA-binding response OmpR family regulator n=1 Tax=Rhizobium halophytocola TaxID=735519 RepID=A0ABS4E4F8_9HYPH|nr:response regulator transcription factor [Rhizobium halophytocola]MBP1852819.1 DNA-binding response OmpR family regulator [Rhizobium halophytocola]